MAPIFAGPQLSWEMWFPQGQGRGQLPRGQTPESWPLCPVLAKVLTPPIGRLSRSGPWARALPSEHATTETTMISDEW